MAALQIARMEPERRFDIVIASPDLGAVPPYLWDGPIRWVLLDVSAIPQIHLPNARITLGTFYRHLLPELLQDDYARLLYMDTDTWLRRPGIQGLFDRIAGDWPLAASLTFLHQPELRTRASAKNQERSREVIRDLGGTRGRFFQSGVMVMQTGPHVAARIGPRTLEFAANRYDLLQKHKVGRSGGDERGGLGSDGDAGFALELAPGALAAGAVDRTVRPLHPAFRRGGKAVADLGRSDSHGGERGLVR